MASEDEIEKRREKRLRRSRLLTISILVVALTISVLVAQYTVVNNYVSKNLSQFVENRINENMDADSYFHFDSLKVSVWKNRISTRNISLHLKMEGEVIAQAPILIINVGSLLKFWWKDELLIEQLILESPYVEVIKINEEDTSYVGDSTSSSIDEIIENINLLKLRDIHLKNANIRFYEKNTGSNKKQLTFQLNDLSIDLQRLKVEASDLLDLETEKLTISLKDQEYILPDSSMQVVVKRIDYDHSHKGFDFTDISIISLPDKELLLDLPHLEAHQFLIDNGKVSIDSFHIAEPHILITQQMLDLLKASDQKKSPIKIPFIQSVEINTIGLKDGKLGGAFADSLGFSIENWGLTISNVGWNQDDENPYHVGLAKMQLYDLNLYQSNNPSLLKLKEVSVEYPENNLFIDSISFDMKSLQGGLASLALYSLDIQSLSKNEFKVEELILKQPNIQIQNGDLNVETKGSTKMALFDKWDIRKVRVENLDVLIDQSPHWLEIDNADLHIADFNLNSDQELTLDNLNDFTFFLPTATYLRQQENVELNINSTYYTSSDSMLSISKGNFKNTSTSINWKGLNVKNGTDLTQPVDSLILKYFSIGSYEITHKIEAKTSKKSQTVPAVIIDSLRLVKGYIKVVKEKDFLIESLPLELVIEGLVYNDSTWWHDNLSLMINDISAKSSELNTNIDSLSIKASENSILFTNISVIAGDTLQNQIQSNIREIEINTYDFLELFNQPENIRVKDITITNPQVLVGSKEANEEATLKIENAWPSNAPTIDIDQLNILDGAFEKNSNESQLELSGLSLQLSAIELSDDSLLYEKNLGGLFYAQSYNGFLDEVHFQNALDSVLIENIKLGEVISTDNFSHISTDVDRTVAFDRIILEGFQPNQWLINNRIKATSFLIDHPHVKIKQATKDSDSQKSFPIEIILDSIDVVNADLDLEWGANQALKLSPLNISMGGVQYNSELETFQWPANTYEISTKNLEFKTKNGLNMIRLDEIVLDNSQLKITDFLLEPLLEREAYFTQIGYETDHIHLTIPSIRLEIFDQKLLLKDSVLDAAKLIIEQPTLNLFRDQNYPDPEPLYKAMPVSAIQSIPFPMRIDTIEVSEASVTYEFIPEGGLESGKFTFGDLNAKLASVTNTPEQSEMMNVFVTANAMDSIPMYVAFDFDLNSNNDEFSFKGSVAPHSMTTFNGYTENGAFVKVISGNTKNLSFAVQANDTVGYGTMDFAYNNLKIAMLDKETYSQTNADESIVSFIANTFFVRKRNRFISRYRQGDIYFERLQHKAIFNFLAKLFISGTASSVGFKKYKKEVESVKETINGFD